MLKAPKLRDALERMETFEHRERSLQDEKVRMGSVPRCWLVAVVVLLGEWVRTLERR